MTACCEMSLHTKHTKQTVRAEMQIFLKVKPGGIYNHEVSFPLAITSLNAKHRHVAKQKCFLDHSYAL
jgi:hypothetical protein